MKEKANASENEHEAIERCVPIAAMKQIVEVSQEPPEYLRNAQIGIGRVPDGETLIIGDVLAGNLMIGCFRLYGLPIDPRTMILWEQDARNRRAAWMPTREHRARIVELHKYNTRRFNESVRKGSRFIAGSDKSTIEALTARSRE